MFPDTALCLYAAPVCDKLLTVPRALGRSERTVLPAELATRAYLRNIHALCRYSYKISLNTTKLRARAHGVPLPSVRAFSRPTAALSLILTVFAN